MANHFGDRLYEAVKTKRTPLIVGLDPVYSRLPAAITSRREMNDEFDVASAVDAIFDYCTQVLRVMAPMVPAVKINSAFFEKYLWEGVETYYALVSEANEHGRGPVSPPEQLPAVWVIPTDEEGVIAAHTLAIDPGL